MNKPTFLIISPFDNNSHPQNAPTYAEISKITSKSVIDYSNSHGYYYAICDEDLSGRAISWDKVFLTRKYLQEYSYVWCIDSDVQIINHNRKLEDIVDKNHDVFITCYYSDINHLNTGSIIYRNSEWTHNFLKEIWEDAEFIEPRPNCFFEQSAIMKWYKNHPDEQHHFKMLKVRDCNSHYHGGMTHMDVNYQKGDLCVHLCGTDNYYRMETFKEFEKYITLKDKDVQNFNVKLWDR